MRNADWWWARQGLQARGRLLHRLASRRPAPGLVPTLVLVLMLMLVPGLSGCSAARWLGLLPLNPLTEVQVVAAADANQGSATAIDLVFVYDSTTQAALPRTGPAWFAAKAALQVGLGSGIDVVSVEIPPATTLAPVALPGRHGKAIAVLAFANAIPVAAQPVAALTAYACARILVDAQATRYQPC